MFRRGALALVILLGLSGVAAAGEPPPTDAQVEAEIASLEAQIARGAGQVEALASEGCAVACQALGSMRRSADRLCGLEQGPRCAGARGKVREAEERVRVACPSCSVAGEPTPVARADLDDKPRPAPAAPAPSQMEAVAVRRGGCAGCEIGGEAPGGAGLLALAAGLALVAARRSRRGARPR